LEKSLSPRKVVEKGRPVQREDRENPQKIFHLPPKEVEGGEKGTKSPVQGGEPWVKDPLKRMMLRE